MFTTLAFYLPMSKFYQYIEEFSTSNFEVFDSIFEHNVMARKHLTVNFYDFMYQPQHVLYNLQNFRGNFLGI